MTQLAVMLLLCSALSAQTPDTFIQLFSAPDAGAGKQQGTYPLGMNNNGDVVGTYIDSNNMSHGFTYNQTTGTLTQFDPFGSSSEFSEASAVNDSGTVVGWFQAREFNPQGLVFGFIRTPEGTYTRFGASIGQFVDTYPIAINSTGNIAGIWFDTSSTDYPYANCFVKIGGIETTFSPPNRGNGCNATAINSSGEIAGYFQDMQNVTHGFVRESGGAITVFDPPSSTATWATSINTSGQISGYYNVSAGPQQAFIRNSDGSFTTFAVPTAISLTFNAVFNPQTVAINDSGETAGVMVTNGGTAEGWIRSPQGTVSSFQTCGQTGIVALNTAGHATGFCGGVGSMFSYEGWNF